MKTLFKGRVSKVLIAVIVVLLLLPELIRFALVVAIPRAGLGEASIDDVDLNLFNGTVSVNGFSLERENTNKLSFDRLGVDVGWLRLLWGEIHVERLMFEGGRLAVLQSDSGQWEVVIPLVAGDKEPEAESDDVVSLPKLGAEILQLTDVEIEVKSPLLEGLLAVDALTLNRISSWRNQPLSLALAAAWNDAPILIDIFAMPWENVPRLQGKLRLSQFQLQDLAGLIPSDIAGPVSGVVNIDLQFDASRRDGENMKASVDGTVSLDQLALQYRHLALNASEFLWQGAVALGLEGAAKSVAVQGDIQSAGLLVEDTEQKMSLLGWKSLSFSNLSADQAMNVDFDALQIIDLDAIGAAQDGETDTQSGRIYAAEVSLDGLSLIEGRDLTINSLVLDDMQHQLVIMADGVPEIKTILNTVLAGLQVDQPSVEELPDEVAGQSEESVEQIAGAEPFVFRMKQAQIQGDSYIAFTDRRFNVPVKQRLTIDTLSVTGLDQSHSDSPATLALKGKLGEFSALSVAGNMKPFAEKLGLNLKGEVEAVPLPSLSPYSEAYLGYHLNRGQYDHRFEVNIANDEIVLENMLFLRQLRLESVDPDKPQPMARELNVPLAFALDMLRDGDDNIELEVPIKGRMDQPDVGISDVVNAALGNALKAGATSYLTLALQPYGAALMAADYVGDRLSTIQLDSIVYEGGVDALTPEQQGYTTKIGGLLTARPNLQLTLCGSANDEDKLVLQAKQPDAVIEEAALVALAEERAAQVKRQLIAKGVESRRLFLCQPSYGVKAARAVTLTM